MPPKPPYLFARIPLEVLNDPNLTLSDLRVYGAMAGTLRGGNIVALSQRALAELAGINRRTVRNSLAHLARLGHLSVAVSRLSQRSVFQLRRHRKPCTESLVERHR
jgi:hypothetical protein